MSRQASSSAVIDVPEGTAVRDFRKNSIISNRSVPRHIHHAPSDAGGRRASIESRVRTRPRHHSTATENDFSAYAPVALGRRWVPGAEPGIDVNNAHAGLIQSLQHECEITVTEFDDQTVTVNYLENENIKEWIESDEFTKRTPSSESKNGESEIKRPRCRWINVNGLSWDVISELAKALKFHRLAVEDLVARRNRTKADWYLDHVYMVLPLQKLVHNHTDDCEHEADEGIMPSDDKLLFHNMSGSTPAWQQKLAKMFRRKKKPASVDVSRAEKSGMDGGSSSDDNFGIRDHNKLVPQQASSRVRTLQSSHIGPNIERAEYMETHSELRKKGLAVAIEQVSIFLMADNTVISFFEASGDEVEIPILTRLASKETIIRRSNDASLVVQAIIDAIVDLAIPVTYAYQDAVDELELNVMTDPSIRRTKSLYILTTEISQFSANLSPISTLLKGLRDHQIGQYMMPFRPDLGMGASTPGLQPEGNSFFPTTPAMSRRPVMANANGSSPSNVVISQVAHTYFADVEDHILLMVGTLSQMQHAATSMSDLIFNTIGGYQDESMRQLTLVTIIFLPMTFLVGYYGQNFAEFWAVQQHSDAFFWYTAMPVVAAFATWIFRDQFRRTFERKKARGKIMHKRRQRGATFKL